MSLTFGVWCPIHSGGWTERKAITRRENGWPVAEQATLLAESMGFKYDLVAARWYGPVLEVYSTTAALAARTSSIHLISAIHSGLVQPQVVAKIGANIDLISNGRFHVNLVSGTDDASRQYTMYGGTWLDHDARYARSAEFIQTIKGMWTTQPYSFSGDYFQLHEVDLVPKPVQDPHPEVFLGGSSPAALDLTARECDWLFVHGKTAAETREVRGNLRQRAGRYGRQVRVAISGMVMIRDSVAEAEREIRVLEELAATDRTARTHMMGLEAGLWGTADKIAETIAQYARDGVEMVLIQGPSIVDDLKRFQAEIVPALACDQASGYLTVG